MKAQVYKPALFIKKGAKLPPTGPAFAELFLAVLGKDAFVRFQARGLSMTPFIRDGDIIIVAPLKDYKLQIGDVASYIHPQSSRVVVHRVVGKKGDSFLIKGDGVPELDGLVQLKNIFGYVKKIERNGKKIRIGFGLEKFFIAFISRIQLLLPILFLIRNLARPIKRPQV